MLSMLESLGSVSTQNKQTKNPNKNRILETFEIAASTQCGSDFLTGITWPCCFELLNPFVGVYVIVCNEPEIV